MGNWPASFLVCLDKQEAMRKFKVGDRVTYDPGMRRTAPPGEYSVVSVLPLEDSEVEYAYRIKSVDEVTERVARENQLTLSPQAEPKEKASQP